jgi:ATP-dependent Clp protease protease subunit
MAENAGRTFEEIERDSDRDNWMTSLEAKEYGLVDEVLTRHKA